MIITHAIIKQRYQEVLEKRQKRKEDLQRVAQKLLKSYKESLSLPTDMWRDSNAVPRHYVSTGLRNERGLYQQAPLSSLELDDDFILTFIISTVIGESKDASIELAEVVVSIYKEIGAYHVIVGNHKNSFKVVTVDAADAFDIVNNAIKESVISWFADDRLDW